MRIIFCFAVLLSLSSCSEDLRKNPSIRRIINETRYSVDIQIFSDDERFRYQIDAFDTLDIIGFCTSGIETYCSLGWHGEYPFANIKFNNERVQMIVINYDVEFDPNQKFINSDPVDSEYGSNSYVRSDEDGIRVYTYRITQEDYENAEPIE